MSKTHYELEIYFPLPLCNSFSMHLIKTQDCMPPTLLDKPQIFIADTNGVLFIIQEGTEDPSFDLKEHLNEKPLEDFSLELVCSDLMNDHVDNNTDDSENTLLTYIATCWVFYDDLFRPERYMIVLLRLNKDYTFEMLFKEDITFAPTCTRMRLVDDQLYWLIFGHNSTIQCYQCNLNEDTENGGDNNAKDQPPKIVKLDKFVEIFPSLRQDSIFGAMTRTDQLTIENFHFEVMGFDTGYLVASVCCTKDNVLLDRKLIKYNTPISIAMFVNLGFVDQEVFVVISSTIGPAALWSLKFDNEKKALKWQVKCQLLESDKSDCVITGSVIMNETILIGTYTEQLLFYSIKDALCFPEVGPINQINVGAPILSIIPTNESLLVLSSKGVQKFNCTLEDDIENVIQSSNSSSPIQYLTND